VPKLSKQLGNVRGTFWQLEALCKSPKRAESGCFIEKKMVADAV